jgi:NADPH:quinone reductase-like Zn-dependent oxidoreductase/imidazolonepropionase-like amidohydrolase
MTRITIIAAWLTFAVAASAEKIALTGATLINPGDNQVIENAIILIDGNRIAKVGEAKSFTWPEAWGLRIDCTGKFIFPGYIDTHVHFFQSGDLFTRPDGVDLNSIRPYKDEVAWIKSHLDDTFTRYLRSGITSVVDVGGPFWNFEVRNRANSAAKAPRVAVAGPLISSVSRPQLDLGDPPIVKIDNPGQAREFVRKLAAQNPDLVKIWYIVDQDHPVDSFRPIVRATVEESHARKIRVAVHATELETARAAVEEGADVLVHSVIDKPVDDAFVKLLQDRHTILCPTLVVFERYGRTFANKLNLTPEEKAWGNPEVIATLDVTKVPPDKLPDRIKTALADPNAALDRIRKTYDVALKNLKTLEDAGVTIAAGTDAGNIGTIHGPALFREFQLMKEAGLTPMQILQCATANAAKLFGGETGSHLGKIENGYFADLVILKSNPVEDINRASDIESVMKNGVLYAADSLLAASATAGEEIPKTMKAVVAHEYGGPNVLQYEDAPVPEPKENELLVRVIASGVNPADSLIVGGKYAREFGTHLPLVPGYDMAGVVVKTDAKVTKLKVGDPVYAYLLWGGGWAQYCVTNEAEAALKPKSLTFAEAAAVPLAALTAWQALIDIGKIDKGQTVLIHGGSGGVGGFAIQIAKARGARVIATASTQNQDLLKKLGADTAIDYTKTKFEDVVKDVDLVLDPVGRDTLARSYGVVKKGGILVTIVSRCDPAELEKHGIRGASLSSHPDANELAEITKMIEQKKLKPIVSQVLSLSDAAKADEQAATHHTRGKIVLKIADEPNG